MPLRSLYDRLPEDIRQTLDEQLSHRQPDYRSLVTWLAGMDRVVTVDTLRRWRRRLDRGRVSADPLIDTALRSTIDTFHKATLKVQEDPSASEVALLSRALTGLVQALAGLQKLRTQTNEDVRQAAAQEVSKAAQKAGLSDEIRQLIEREILGLQH